MTAKCLDWRFVNRVVKSLYRDAKFLSVTFPIFEKTLYRTNDVTFPVSSLAAKLRVVADVGR